MKAQVHIFWSGAFGESINRHLSEITPELTSSAYTGGLPHVPDAGVFVVASWRPVMDLCHIINTHCYKTQSIFVPAVVEDFVLRIGPVVVPGVSACWECWAARSLQHDSSPNRRAALWHHYNSNPRSGPKGHLEGYAVIAASRIMSSIRDCQLAGAVWEMDMLSRHIVIGQLCGVDGCAHCGRSYDAREKSHVSLRHSLAYLWK